MSVLAGFTHRVLTFRRPWHQENPLFMRPNDALLYMKCGCHPGNPGSHDFGPDCPVIYLHVCGSGTGLLEFMADTDVDCIEPLDPLGGVEVRDAKARVGDRVALMGGVHTVKLARGTVEDVRADVARRLSEGAPGGGYILAAGDMLPTETSQEKVELMLEMSKAWNY